MRITNDFDERDIDLYSGKSIHQLFALWANDENWNLNNFLETVFDTQYCQAIDEAIAYHNQTTRKFDTDPYSFFLSIGPWKFDPLITGYFNNNRFRCKFSSELESYVSRWNTVDLATVTVDVDAYTIEIVCYPYRKI